MAVGAARGAVMRGEGCHRRQGGGGGGRRRWMCRVERREGRVVEMAMARASGVEGQQDAESTGAQGSTHFLLLLKPTLLRPRERSLFSVKMSCP